MSFTTPAEIAQRLRVIADALDMADKNGAKYKDGQISVEAQISSGGGMMYIRVLSDLVFVKPVENPYYNVMQDGVSIEAE